MRTVALSLAALTLLGCVGSLDDPEDGGRADGADGADGEDGDGDGDGPGDGTDPSDPRLQSRVWRLTSGQYNGEVQRMFPGAPAVDLPDGSSEAGFLNIANTARIDAGNATQFNEAARVISNWVIAEGAPAARCASFGTSACVDELLEWFPEEAFRRPVTTDEIGALRGVYDDTVGEYDEEWAFAAVVRSVLLAPEFLYRYEIGPDGGDEPVVELEEYEIASLLSFTLTNAGPDASILADADAGTLHDPDVREKHVRRLMDGSADVWQRFFWQWLKMSTLQSQGNETELAPELVADLEAEYKAFVANVVVGDCGNLKALLTTSHTWATPLVADYYGVTHPGGGVEELDLDPEQRGGVLTLGAWLVSHGKKGRDNVVRRGMGLYRDAMCNAIVPLTGVDLEEEQGKLVGKDATIKEIADARSSTAPCSGCHATSDPIGLSFESYAGDGRWQTTYPDGKPVESSVVLNDVPYATAPELSGALAEDEMFQQCLVERFGYFVMGAEFGTPIRVRAAKASYDAFADSGGSFEELLVSLVKDRSFIERRKQ